MESEPSKNHVVPTMNRHEEAEDRDGKHNMKVEGEKRVRQMPRKKIRGMGSEQNEESTVPTMKPTRGRQRPRWQTLVQTSFGSKGAGWLTVYTGSIMASETRSCALHFHNQHILALPGGRHDYSRHP